MQKAIKCVNDFVKETSDIFSTTTFVAVNFFKFPELKTTNAEQVHGINKKTSLFPEDEDSET